MAFSDLKPVRVFDEASGCTFIIGDVFAVYHFGTELPDVFEWGMLKEVTENRKALIFETERSKYVISKSCFLAMMTLLSGFLSRYFLSRALTLPH